MLSRKTGIKNSGVENQTQLVKERLCFFARLSPICQLLALEILWVGSRRPADRSGLMIGRDIPANQ